MKLSIFNSRIKISNSTDLLYNALKDSYMLIRRETLIPLQGNNSNYLRGGFVVEETFDEIEEVKLLSRREDLNDDVFTLIINPTLSCNFNCWYCYEEKRKSTFADEKTIENIKKLILSICKKNKVLKLSFFGGEPFLKFNSVVKPIIDYAIYISSNEGCLLYLSFTTNASLINKNILDYLKNKTVSFQITLDGDKKLHDKTRFFANKHGSYDIILKNIRHILQDKHNINLRINYTEINVNSISTIAKNLIDLIPKEYLTFLSFSLHQVWQKSDIDLREPIDRQIEILHNYGLRVAKPLFDNVRQSCYGDKKNSVVVNYNGDLFKCTAVDFLNVQRKGFLSNEGKLIWENDSLNEILNAKFKNKECLKCRILPICNGACSQKILTAVDKDKCIFNFSEKDKDNIIIDKFQDFIINNS